VAKERSIGSITWIGPNKCRLRVSAGYDDYGRRIQPSKIVTATSETDAERQLLALYNERNKFINERVSKSPKTLDEMYDTWMRDHVIQNCEARTIEYYRELWERYIKDKSGAKLKTLSVRHIQGIINGVDAGSRTKQGVFALLRAMLNKAVKWEYMDENPCKKIDPPKYEAGKKDVYNKKDLQTMVDLLKSKPVIFQLAVWLATSRGMRREEIVGLKWNDINFDDNAITVRRAVVRVKKKGLIEKDTKTGDERILPLSPELIALLKKLRAEQSERRLQLGNKWVDKGWLFAGWNGEVISPDTITRWWKEFCTENNLRNIRFHDLRHTAATVMLTNKADIASVSSILGHSRQSTTLNIYSHVLNQSKSEALWSLDSTLSSAAKK